MIADLLILSAIIYVRFRARLLSRQSTVLLRKNCSKKAKRCRHSSFGTFPELRGFPGICGAGCRDWALS